MNDFIEQQEAEKLDLLRDLSIAFSRVEELEARVDDLEAQLHKLLLSRAGARVFTPNSVPKLVLMDRYDFSERMGVPYIASDGDWVKWSDIEQLHAELTRMKIVESGSIEEIAHANKTIEQLQSAQQWISVSERLPDAMHRNCLSYDGSEISWAFYTSDGKWAIGNNLFTDITHWMPLPAPPEDKT